MSQGGADFYPVVIAGASFAGLAVASQLKGGFVIVDQKDIGTGQTSACGIPVETAEAVGAQDALLQTHSNLVVYTGPKVFPLPLHRPFATFDYGRFCRTLAAGLEERGGRFIKARVLGMTGDGAVQTSAGLLKGRFVVDATGSRAKLAESMRPGFARSAPLGFGMEDVVAGRADDLHFYIASQVIPKGIGWVFPADGELRIGVGSYHGLTRLSGRVGSLKRQWFQPTAAGATQGVDMPPVSSSHGGYIPAGLRKPLVGDVIVVGDAAGHCLPLSGEGIRTALYFGIYAGFMIQQALEGRLADDEARAKYQAMVLSHKQDFFVLRLFQEAVSAFQDLGNHAVFSFMIRYRGGWLMKAFFDRYLDAFDVDALKKQLRR